MEKNRWSLIFIGLCLALVFSVSSVEAQKNCDFDEDGFIKDTNKCHNQNPVAGIDCDDTTPDASDPTPCVGPAPSGTLVICHFKNILKHCETGENTGIFVGGGVRTIDNDLATIERHLAHGDCIEPDSFITNPHQDDGDPITCGNHCIATNFPQAGCR